MQNAIDQLAAAGIEIQGAPELGRLVRCRTEDDRAGKQSGWYVLHEMRLDNGDTVVVGRYGNWKRFGAESLKIEMNRPSLSPEERKRLEAEQRKLRDKAADEKRERAEQAASRALRIWQKLPDFGKSDYLQKKGVPAYGLKFSRGSIVVPVRTAAGLVGLQFIAGDGSKKFLTGTPVEGAYHVIGDLTKPARVWIAEGYATAATVHQAMSEPVVVAFNAGNLVPVAKALRAQFPDIEIAIAADNDRFTTDAKGNPCNPGVEYARKAAAAVQARVVVPEFAEASA